MRRHLALVPARLAACCLALTLLGALAACDAFSAQSARHSHIGQPAIYAFEGAITSSTPYSVIALDAAAGSLDWRHGTNGKGTLRPVRWGDAVFATVYRDTASAYHQGVLEALSAADGTLLWQHTVAAPIESLPTVANDMVFLSSDVGSDQPTGKLEALRATDGTVEWQASVGSYPSSPAVVGNMVYVLAGSQVLAFDAQTGAPAWSYDTGSPVTSGNVAAGIPGPVVVDGTVYAEPITRAADGSADETLIALNATTGTLLWQQATGGIASQPVVDQGLVYFTAINVAPDNHSVLSALHAQDGVPRWTYTPPPQLVLTAPVAGDGQVYVGAASSAAQVTAGGVLALASTDGKQLWRWSPPSVSVAAGVGAPLPLLDGGLLGIQATTSNASQGCFAVLDALTGTQRWCKPLPAWGDVTLSNGVLYTVSYTAANPDGEMAAVRWSDGTVLWHFQAGH